MRGLCSCARANAGPAFGWKTFSDSESFTLSGSLLLNADAIITPLPAALPLYANGTWRDRAARLAQATTCSESRIASASALLDPGGKRAPGTDRTNALRNRVVDRQGIEHATMVADDARVHHLKQRIADLFGGHRSGELLLLNDGEKLQVARRASARERARGRRMRRYA